MDKSYYDIVVVGAGPAGLLAAGKAAIDGAKVLLLEKMEKPARKLRITGKGRCNITNIKTIDEYFEELNPEPRFLRDAFASFFSDDIIKLLNDQGVDTVIERGQRVFPASGKAWDVAEALIKWSRSNGVEIINHAKVEKIHYIDGKVQSIDYKCTKQNVIKSVSCKSVVLTTGGKSYPATGSTGDGYLLAEDCGHSITPLRPTLVGLETKPIFSDCSGLSLKNINLVLRVDDKKVDEEFGELEITPYGLSGPIILRVSRMVVDSIAKQKSCELEIDLKPALTHQKLDQRLQREIQENPRNAIVDLARNLLPKQMAFQMLDDLGLAAQKVVARLSAEERKMIRLWLKELKFEVVGHRSWNEAIATAGGVSLKEVNPRTLESRITAGIYFAGEVLDLDASTGGYNLQIAFSTGWLAGKSAALNVLSNKKIE